MTSFVARWPRRTLICCGGVVVAMPVVTLLDYRASLAAVPDVRRLVGPARDAAVAREVDLAEGWLTRGWLYALAMLAAIAVLAVVGLRADPPE